MRRIAVITDGIDDGSAGVGTYARGLASALSAVSSDDITFVHRRRHSFYRGRPELVFPGWGSKLIRKQILMARELHARRFDLVHETFHFPPFFGPTGYRKVMTIHDMTPFILPKSNMALKNWLWHRLLVPPLARRADHVMTDSENSRQDIIRLLKLPADRVSVAHLAADACFRRQPEEETERVRTSYSLPKRFLLFVGMIEPRKNLVRLIRAFEEAELGDVALVIAGGLGWQYKGILHAVQQSPAAHRIVMPGRIAAEDLPALYSAALAFVYVPLYEGFGLPPLEAMQCGCPVITSNSSSLPEVVGDAALAVSAVDVKQIRGAMERIVWETSLRTELREKGEKRAQRFNWRTCAIDTLAAYDRTLAA